MRLNANFRLMTEESFRSWLSEHPERGKYQFDGYCTMTESAVEIGPDHNSEHNCNNCYPESHFIMVPTEFLS